MELGSQQDKGRRYQDTYRPWAARYGVIFTMQQAQEHLFWNLWVRYPIGLKTKAPFARDKHFTKFKFIKYTW